MSFDLRTYQKQAIDDLRRALGDLMKRICLYSPTGSGKTEIAIALILLALGKGKRVAFLVNRIELCVQASRRFHKAGIEHGMIQGDNSFNTGSRVIIASIHSVARRGLPDADLIITDECHGAPGSQAYRDLLFRLNNVPVIGLTATPFSRGMGKHYKELGGPLFEKLVSAATIRELIDLEHLVDVVGRSSGRRYRRPARARRAVTLGSKSNSRRNDESSHYRRKHLQKQHLV